MSELAPFVAAAIRDKVVEGLLEENKVLKEENNRLNSLRTVTIHGISDDDDGTTIIYGRGCLDKDGKAMVLGSRFLGSRLS